ncbi:MAG: lysylphosphatidylglycerol synthase transmembrane domain-containing protein [Chloroflexota bacterium]
MTSQNTETTHAEKRSENKILGKLNWRNILSGIVVLTISLVLLYFALSGTDWTTLISTVQTGDWRWLLAIMGMLTISYTVRSIRWRVLLEQDKPLPFKKMFGATIIGYLGNAFLPARSGELLKTVTVKRSLGIPMVLTLTTIFTERLLDAAFLVIMALIIIAQIDAIPDWLQSATQIMGILGFVALVILFLVPYFAPTVKRLLSKMPLRDTLQDIIVSLMDKLVAGIRVLHEPSRAFKFGILTLVAWSTDLAIGLFISQAFGLSMGVAPVILITVALGLSSAIPSTPGYVGVYQFVAVTVLSQFGYTQEEALIFVFTLQLMEYTTLLLWSLPSLALTGKKRDKTISSISQSQLSSPTT